LFFPNNQVKGGKDEGKKEKKEKEEKEEL